MVTDIRTGNDSFKKLSARYSICFAVFFLICIFPFFFTGKRNFFGGDDGIYQQYIYFLYTGKWIKELFGNIFTRHIFEIPMWDMSIGMGADPIITLSSSVNPLTDPLCWISAFVPLKYAETVFNIVIALKLYLSGLSFTSFAYGRGHKGMSAVAGAMVYTFSSIIFIGFYQVFFLNAFILFPLLMLAACMLWEQKKHRAYAAALMCCAAYSFYFTYMMVLLLVIYCVIRYICEWREKKAERLLSLIIRYVIWTSVGIAMGIGIQIPSMLNVAGLKRMNSVRNISLIATDNLEMIFKSFSYYNIGTDSFWGFSSVVLIAVLLLFAEKKKDLLIKILFVLYSVSFFLPVIGSLFNGMNTPSCRYIFGYILLLSYIVSLTFDRFSKISSRTLLIVIGIAVFACAVGVIVFGDKDVIISSLSLMIVAVTVFLINKKGIAKDIAWISLILASCFLMCFSALKFNIRNAASTWGQPRDLMFDSAGDVFIDDLDTSDSRYDRLPYAYVDVPVNSTMITGVQSFDSYNSNINTYIDQYFIDMGIVSNSLGVYQCGLRGRDYLEVLNGTEYISVFEGNSKAVSAPYAYEAAAQSGDYTLYQSSNGASIAYLYDEAAPYSMFEELDPMEREELMMQACVLEDAAPREMVRGFDEIGFTLGEVSGVEIMDDRTFSVSESGYITLDIDTLEGREVNVLISGIHSDAFFLVMPQLMNDQEIVKTDFFAGVSDQDIYYHWKDTLLFSYGVVEEPVDSIRLCFNTPGNYSLDSVKIYTRTPEQIDATLQSFYSHADIADVQYCYNGRNDITVDLTADSDKYLYLAVPYSNGWSATVDGDPAEILRANGAFMAIPVKSGEHSVKLTYITPYLKEGILLSIVTIVSVMVYETVSTRKSKKPSTKK